MVTTTNYLKPLALLVWAALAASVTMAVVLANSAHAAPFTVTNTDDTGAGSLRQAIDEANASAGEDEIGFDPSLSGQTITLASQLPTISDSAGLTTIDGESADITISGDDQVRVFRVDEDAKLTLANLTVANGNSASGLGGGILNNGTLTLSNSTLSGNSANSGGGIDNDGTATVSNSTLSGNSASGSGGGILNSDGATLTVTNSTFSDNSANVGGGIDNDGAATLRNTIVANSTSGGDCSGTITNGGYNLSSDDSCGFTKNKSRSSTDPLLGRLEDNGGPTPTHALLEGSPAIDKGKSFGETTDQRGLPRPFDLGEITNATRGDGSDIGAYEQLRCSGDVVHGAGAVVGTLGPDDDLTGGPGNDTILGLGGSDKIWGLDGNDIICAGKGNDRVYGGNGNDKVEGSEGKDVLHGDKGEDELYGLKGEDTLKTKDGMHDLADGGPRRDVCKTDSQDERVSCR